MDRDTPYYGDNVDIPDGRKIDRPPHSVAFRQAARTTGKWKRN
jgi:hypothetical protein